MLRIAVIFVCLSACPIYSNPTIIEISRHTEVPVVWGYCLLLEKVAPFINFLKIILWLCLFSRLLIFLVLRVSNVSMEQFKL